MESKKPTIYTGIGGTSGGGKMSIPIFDCHVHIENNYPKCIDIVGLENYLVNVYKKNLIVNFLELYDKYKNFVKVTNNTLTCIFDFKKNKRVSEFVDRVNNHEISAAKIHSKIQCIEKRDYKVISKQLKKIPTNIPVVVDAWYDWPDISVLPDLQGIIRLAEEAPDRKFVIAHAGGYKILEYFYHTRKIDNIYYDMSLTLGYMKGTSVWKDVKHFIKYIPCTRIMYGSDYPYSPPGKQLKRLNKIMNNYQFSEAQRMSILYGTASNVLTPVC